MVSDDEFRQACKRKMDTILSFAGTKERIVSILRCLLYTSDAADEL